MRSKKYLFWITLIISVISLIGLLRGLQNSNVLAITQGLFCSGLLAFIMTVAEYFVERRNAMEAFYDEASEITNHIKSLVYFRIDEMFDSDLLEALIEYENNKRRNETNTERKLKWIESLVGHCNQDEVVDQLSIEKYYIQTMTIAEKHMFRCMGSYITLYEYDIRKLRMLYGNLDFIFMNKCIRDRTFSDIYNVLEEVKTEIWNPVMKFKDYIDGGDNVEVVLNTLRELNDLFFKKITNNNVQSYFVQVYATKADKLYFNLEWFRTRIYSDKNRYRNPNPIVAFYKTLN